MKFFGRKGNATSCKIFGICKMLKVINCTSEPLKLNEQLTTSFCRAEIEGHKTAKEMPDHVPDKLFFITR